MSEFFKEKIKFIKFGAFVFYFNKNCIIIIYLFGLFGESSIEEKGQQKILIINNLYCWRLILLLVIFIIKIEAISNKNITYLVQKNNRKRNYVFISV